MVDALQRRADHSEGLFDQRVDITFEVVLFLARFQVQRAMEGAAGNFLAQCQVARFQHLCRVLGMRQRGCVDQCAKQGRPEQRYTISLHRFHDQYSQRRPWHSLDLTSSERLRKFPARFERLQASWQSTRLCSMAHRYRHR
ncbi:hypothetical protein D3C81_1723410 [compost metagenome]